VAAAEAALLTEAEVQTAAGWGRRILVADLKAATSEQAVLVPADPQEQLEPELVAAVADIPEPAAMELAEQSEAGTAQQAEPVVVAPEVLAERTGVEVRNREAVRWVLVRTAAAAEQLALYPAEQMRVHLAAEPAQVLVHQEWGYKP
jgi:hypothetical protein